MQSTLGKNENQRIAASRKSSSLWRKYPLISIAMFWLLCLAFIGVQGNFPLNDDWIYAESVQHLLATGQIRLLACAPACVFHLITAAAACKIFGFNYVVLRAVGFFWAVLGSYAMYGCCRQLRLPQAPSLLITLCFAANPLMMSLAFSFMTDTPAVALTLAYTYFLLHALKNQSEKSFVFSSLCLLAATCVRQNLGFLALVNAAILLCYWIRKKHSWSLAVGLVIAPLACGYIADKWMLSTNDFTSLYVWYKGMVAKQISIMCHNPGRLIAPLLQIAGELLCYLGLFALPILTSMLPALGRFFRNKGNINPTFPVLSASVIVFSLCKFIIGESRWMPFNQNLLRLPELGAHTILGINHVALANKWRQILTWVSGFAGFVIGVFLLDTIAKTVRNLWAVCRAKATPKRRFGSAICSVAVVLIFLFQFAFTSLQSTFSDIDRYYLFPYLGASLCLALAWRWHKVKLLLYLAVPTFLVIASYSIAATQDMMAWNRARWTALEKLEAQGVNFKQIDGGAEYNYARDPMLFKNLILHDTWYELTHRGQAPRDQWRWWSVAGEDYIVSFSPVPEYEQVSKETYWSALAGNKEILVLRHLSTSSEAKN